MEYKIEEIGALFSRKNITSLEQTLTNKAKDGYKFHSVIRITKTGCLGSSSHIGEKITYLAVFVKEE